MSDYRIAEVAARTGFPPSTLRYYEQLELVKPSRTAAGYRTYSDDDIDLLAFVARAKRLELPLEDIRRLADAWRGAECAETRVQLAQLVDAKIDRIRTTLQDLGELQSALERVRRDLDGRTASGRCGPHCACQAGVATA